jgi:hypothetical protein
MKLGDIEPENLVEILKKALGGCDSPNDTSACDTCKDREICEKVEREWGNESEMKRIEILLPASLDSDLPEIIPKISELVKKGLKTDEAILGHALVAGVNTMGEQLVKKKKLEALLSMLSSGEKTGITRHGIPDMEIPGVMPISISVDDEDGEELGFFNPAEEASEEPEKTLSLKPDSEIHMHE